MDRGRVFLLGAFASASPSLSHYSISDQLLQAGCQWWSETRLANKINKFEMSGRIWYIYIEKYFKIAHKGAETHAACCQIHVPFRPVSYCIFLLAYYSNLIRRLTFAMWIGAVFSLPLDRRKALSVRTTSILSPRISTLTSSSRVDTLSRIPPRFSVPRVLGIPCSVLWCTSK